MSQNQNMPDRRKRHTKLTVQRERKRRREPHVDLAALLSIDHACGGCRKGRKCCCSTYEVCVSATEMDRIIRALPWAAKLCPHLENDKGFDNVFEEVGPGLYAIDTTEDGLCLFAFVSRGRIRCSLHAAASAAGLSLEQVKPKACLLWPMNFSEGEEVLSLTDDVLSFSCNSKRVRRSRRLSPSLIEAIRTVYGKDFGAALEKKQGRVYKVRCSTAEAGRNKGLQEPHK